MTVPQHTAISSDELSFAQEALEVAHAAASQVDAAEVPIGCVITHQGRVIAKASNGCIGQHDPSAHAEILALRQAGQALGNYRLSDCDVYVTLEPCPMCAMALIHARVKRVVYGAPDVKGGGCGGVINLAEHPQLNHHTQFIPAFLTSDSSWREWSDTCGQTLQAFFAQRRSENKKARLAQRPDLSTLRTPDAAFENLKDYPFKPHYLANLPGIEHIRIHYVDEPMQVDEAKKKQKDIPTFLCLHGNPAWSYLYRHMIPVLRTAGRVVVPDLIGHGKSDKLVHDTSYSFSLHRRMLLSLIKRLDLQRIVLVCQDWGGILGLTLLHEMPHRFTGLAVMNTTLATALEPLPQGFVQWRDYSNSQPDLDIGRLFKRGKPDLSAEECAAYNAPYPDVTYKSSIRAFPNLVPGEPVATTVLERLEATGGTVVTQDGVSESRAAADFLTHQWQGKTRMFIGATDPVLGLPIMHQLRTMIRGCPEPIVLPEAGHFVQEWGTSIAQQIAAAFGSHS